MRIRYIAAVFSLLMLLGLGYLCAQLTAEEPAAYDMTVYHEKMNQIEEAAAAGADLKQIEARHRCSLLFLTDEDYKSRLNKALMYGALVLDLEEDGMITGKAVFMADKDLRREWSARLKGKVIFAWAFFLAAGYLLLFSVYLSFVKPFLRLKQFAAEVARGKLDVPLPMRRHNFFGAFTESFDLMREELKKAKEKEYQANISKKELVAELSHDIKTPVAAIRATCEVMEVTEKNEKTLEKVAVIAAKADTIEQLINNMFHATLEELEVLQSKVQEEGTPCIPEMFEELKYYGEICMENRVPECYVLMDRLRLEQVINNIVNNSYKYAGTRICVRFEDIGDGIRIIIRDSGPGVAEEELALVTEKFYQGSNAGRQPGSGLGLYLSKMFMEQMQGGMEYYNDHGFTVALYLRKAGIRTPM